MAVLADKLTSVLGKRIANRLADKLDLHTVGDLLRHYPRRYAERGKLTDIGLIEVGEHVTVMATIREIDTRQMRSRKGWITKVEIDDGNRRMVCAFFGSRPHIHQRLRRGVQGLFAGKVRLFQSQLELVHPEYELFDERSDSATLDEFAGRIIPVYPATQGLPSWTVERCVRQVLDTLEPQDDPMPVWLLAHHGYDSLHRALTNIHRPESWAALNSARQRLKWDEAMAIQLIFAQRRYSAVSRPAPACPPKSGGLADAFDRRLPFDLTAGQRDVGAVIADDLAGEHPMNRLLQGEVGSGKTVVALRAMLQVIDSGRQCALLAPTEVLAAQHARVLREMLGELGMAGELGGADVATRIALLTGSMSAKQRKQALLDAAGGAAGIVIGTHALIQDTVSFADLGMVVVDEQHRFGVEQRDALRSRSPEFTSPHVLVMTATPIPRTVAMTVYGDLEISSLREMPEGRMPIATTVVPLAEKPHWMDRVWQRVAEEVGKGHQAYVVCPRIGDEPPAKGNERPGLAVLELAPELDAGPLAGLRIGILHGRMAGEEKDRVMLEFATGRLDVLVATTVIEVGVNVPNATAMVIMEADRFGVSQLHQLRGRVGRGDVPGLCLLVTEAVEGTSTRARLASVASTLDGFELSRIDLELRREGDILGAEQSGRRSGLKLLSLLRDEEVIAEARARAQEIVGEDPALGNHLGLAHLVADVIDPDRAEYLEKA